MRQTLKRAAFRFAEQTNLLPYGVDFATDLKRRFPSLSVNLIFDVGANVGQAAEMLLSRYPRATIHSFEPDPKTFKQLTSRMGGRILAHQIAFSDISGRMRFDDTCAVSELHSIAEDQNNGSLPLVDVVTLDCFCDQNRIDAIDLLKLDTEGNEIKVIAGAAKMINAGRIKAMLVECSLSRAVSKGQIPFSIMQEHMDLIGYVCLGIYHQSPNWGDQTTAEICFANCLFVARHLGQPSPP